MPPCLLGLAVTINHLQLFSFWWFIITASPSRHGGIDWRTNSETGATGAVPAAGNGVRCSSSGESTQQAAKFLRMLGSNELECCSPKGSSFVVNT